MFLYYLAPGGSVEDSEAGLNERSGIARFLVGGIGRRPTSFCARYSAYLACGAYRHMPIMNSKLSDLMNSKLSDFAKKSSRQRKQRERDWIISLN
jgi:hypothetical protein